MTSLFVHIQPLQETVSGLINRIRIEEPFAAMAQLTPTEVRIEQPIQTLVHRPRSILLLQRHWFPTIDIARAAYHNARAGGYVFVHELDDHPDGLEGFRAQNHYSLGCFHALQVSSEEIANFIREQGLHDEIAVFPNQISQLPELKEFRATGPLCLFYASIHRQESWRPYLEALNQALNTLGPAAKIGILHDRELYDALDTPHKAFGPLLPRDRYLHFLQQYDVHLLPLSDTPFNRAKTDLKFIESAALGVVSLASPVVYANSIRQGETGFLFHNPTELHDSILRLARDRAVLGRVRRHAYDHVGQARMLETHILRQYEWYQSLVDRREILTEKLLQRRPELA